MEVEIKKTFEVNVCNDCPHFKEVEDTSVCFDSFDEPNYDWYCTNKDANNKETYLEKYNNKNGVSIGGSYHRNGVCGIPDWCPLKKRKEIEHKEGVYYIENTIDEYRTKITCFCKTLDDARNCIKECSDWFRPKGTGTILFKPFGVNQESVEIERY